ncbi:MAG TPA: medium chain dehydrogenase/reductase family protein, partial [Thermoanaerobaculia bacterium]
VALENEVAVDVETLAIDSASFRQLREAEAAGGKPISEQIRMIVAQRGKMQNPVTGSGGIFLGRVREVGGLHPDAGVLRPGDRIASLVSLTLTPLHLDRVTAVHSESERVDVEGTAILFARTLYGRIPDDLSEEIALAVFDVAGAPASVRARAREGETIVVIGAGKAGLLCLAAAREAVGTGGRVFALDPSAQAVERARQLGLADEVWALDARDPLRVHGAVASATSHRLADLVVNVANAPGTEVASVLCARDCGTVLFFGMATSFSSAALGAEGLAHPATLLIGNGYVPGHAEMALDLVRRYPRLRDALASLVARRQP